MRSGSAARAADHHFGGSTFRTHTPSFGACSGTIDDMGVEPADGHRRVLDELGAACDPDLARPLAGNNPVQQLHAQLDINRELLNAALSYVEERGRLAGAQMAYRHAGRMISGEAADEPAPIVDLAIERARRTHGD